MINLLASIEASTPDIQDTARHVYDGKLDPIAWIIIGIIFIMIAGGLSWCFYRAITAAKTDYQEQLPDEI